MLAMSGWKYGASTFHPTLGSSTPSERYEPDTQTMQNVSTWRSHPATAFFERLNLKLAELRLRLAWPRGGCDACART